MKYKLSYTKAYAKDFAKLSQKDKDLSDEVIARLANGEILESKYKDHALKGDLKGLRDCHIKPDLVLIYKINAQELELIAMRIGSHSKLRI